MKMLFTVLLFAILVWPGMLQAETIYLLDGSTLVGTLVKVDGDTLFVKPSFGGSVKLTRQLIWKIQFSEETPAGHTEAKPATGDNFGFNSAEPGSLLVSFDGLKLSNKIVVHRNKDKEGHERANAIEVLLIVDGEVVGKYVDTEIDKDYREGPETYLKNTISMQDFKIGLPSGAHSAQLVVRNPDYPEYKDAFEHERLNLKLSLGDVFIYPNRQAVVEVGLKKGFLKMGSPKLIVK